MEYITINRLRGNVADFTVSETGIRITFAGNASKNPTIHLTTAQCRLFLNELSESLEVFYPDGESASAEEPADNQPEQPSETQQDAQNGEQQAG